MKFGYRKPSFKKRLSARTSVKRAFRSKVRAPRGWGWVTNPKRAAKNRVYNRTSTSDVLSLILLIVIGWLAYTFWGYLSR
jgi:hypothetical protein